MFRKIRNLVQVAVCVMAFVKKHYAEAEMSLDTLLQQEFSSAHAHIYGDYYKAITA